MSHEKPEEIRYDEETRAMPARDALLYNLSNSPVRHNERRDDSGRSPSSQQLPFIDEATKFGPFEIAKTLEMGGMAILYHAYHAGLNKAVALKVLKEGSLIGDIREFSARIKRKQDDYEAKSTLAERIIEYEENRARFRREASILGSVSHPNIVKLLEYGTIQNHLWVSYDDQGEGIVKPLHEYKLELPDGKELDMAQDYIALELIIGESVKNILKNTGMVEFNMVEMIARQMLNALGFIHSRGIIHRDIKPGNIMVETGVERCVLADFGLARHEENPDSSECITNTGGFAGTVVYMAPEVIKGDYPSKASDIYSLGAVLHEALSGRPHFDYSQREKEYQIMSRILNQRMHVLADQVDPSIKDSKVVKLIDRMKSRYPEERPCAEEGMDILRKA